MRPGQSVSPSDIRTELIITARDAGLIPGPLESLPTASVFVGVFEATTHVVKITVQAGFAEFSTLESNFEEEITEVCCGFKFATIALKWFQASCLPFFIVDIPHGLFSIE